MLTPRNGSEIISQPIRGHRRQLSAKSLQLAPVLFEPIEMGESRFAETTWHLTQGLMLTTEHLVLLEETAIFVLHIRRQRPITADGHALLKKRLCARGGRLSIQLSSQD